MQILEEGRGYVVRASNPTCQSTQYTVQKTTPFWAPWFAILLLSAPFYVLVNVVIQGKPSVDVFLIVLLIVIGTVFVWRWGSICSESILVVRNLGIQLEKETYGGRRERAFYRKPTLREIVTNEGIFLNKVIYYLAFQLDDTDDLLLPFEHIMPRLRSLIEMEKGIQRILFPTQVDAGNPELGGNE